MTLYKSSKKGKVKKITNIDKKCKKFSVSTYSYEKLNIKGKFLKSSITNKNLALAMKNLKKKLISFGKIA